MNLVLTISVSIGAWLDSFHADRWNWLNAYGVSIISVGLFWLIFLGRFLIWAPYQEYKKQAALRMESEARYEAAKVRNEDLTREINEVVASRAALRTALDERAARRKASDALAAFVYSGVGLCNRFRADTPHPSAEELESWAKEVYQILETLGDGYTARFIASVDNSGTMRTGINMLANTHLTWVRCRCATLQEFIRELTQPS